MKGVALLRNSVFILGIIMISVSIAFTTVANAARTPTVPRLRELTVYRDRLPSLIYICSNFRADENGISAFHCSAGG